MPRTVSGIVSAQQIFSFHYFSDRKGRVLGASQVPDLGHRANMN